MKKISIIIPTFNRKKYLISLLKQIFRLNNNIFSINLIVIVDGSTDGTIEYLEDNFHNVDIINGDGSWWYTKSINKGLIYAKKKKPEYILTLNDDIKLNNNFFIKLEEAIQIAPKNSIIGAMSILNSNPTKVLSSGVKKIIWWRNKNIVYHKMFENIDLSLLKGLHKSFVLPGRGMLIPYFIVEELCYFDEKFAQYHSDSDFCLRAKKNGYQSFVSWELIIISYIEKTAIGTSYLRTPFKLFIKGFTNKYSRIYIPDHIRYIFRHGVKPILPLTFIIFLLATFKAHLFNPKIDE